MDAQLIDWRFNNHARGPHGFALGKGVPGDSGRNVMLRWPTHNRDDWFVDCVVSFFRLNLWHCVTICVSLFASWCRWKNSSCRIPKRIKKPYSSDNFRYLLTFACPKRLVPKFSRRVQPADDCRLRISRAYWSTLQHFNVEPFGALDVETFGQYLPLRLLGVGMFTKCHKNRYPHANEGVRTAGLQAETWPEYEQYRVECNASGTNLAARLPPKRVVKQLFPWTVGAFVAGALVSATALVFMFWLFHHVRFSTAYLSYSYRHCL